MSFDEENHPSREELEVRLTAMILGEASPFEQTELRILMEKDPDLARCCTQLGKAAQLIREASLECASGASPQSTPPKLSEERRRALLETLGTPVAKHRQKETQIERRKEIPWLLPLGMAAGIVALLSAVLLMDGVGNSKTGTLQVTSAATPRSTKNWGLEGLSRFYGAYDTDQQNKAADSLGMTSVDSAAEPRNQPSSGPATVAGGLIQQLQENITQRSQEPSAEGEDSSDTRALGLEGLGRWNRARSKALADASGGAVTAGPAVVDSGSATPFGGGRESAKGAGVDPASVQLGQLQAQEYLAGNSLNRHKSDFEFESRAADQDAEGPVSRGIAQQSQQLRFAGGGASAVKGFAGGETPETAAIGDQISTITASVRPDGGIGGGAGYGGVRDPSLAGGLSSSVNGLEETPESAGSITRTAAGFGFAQSDRFGIERRVGQTDGLEPESHSGVPAEQHGSTRRWAWFSDSQSAQNQGMSERSRKRGFGEAAVPAGAAPRAEPRGSNRRAPQPQQSSEKEELAQLGSYFSKQPTTAAQGTLTWGDRMTELGRYDAELRADAAGVQELQRSVTQKGKAKIDSNSYSVQLTELEDSPRTGLGILPPPPSLKPNLEVANQRQDEISGGTAELAFRRLSEEQAPDKGISASSNLSVLADDLASLYVSPKTSPNSAEHKEVEIGPETALSANPTQGALATDFDNVVISAAIVPSADKDHKTFSEARSLPAPGASFPARRAMEQPDSDGDDRLRLSDSSESNAKSYARYGLLPGIKIPAAEKAGEAGASSHELRGDYALEKITDLKSEPSVQLRPASIPAPEHQPEVLTRENRFSTFSLNVSDVSFKLTESSLASGALPDSNTVRAEEFINAFDYHDSEPPPGVSIGFSWERSQYPFAHNRDIIRLSVRAASMGREAGRPLNLVILLDNSGSMERADRVAIVRTALTVLAGKLQPHDRISVVAFARTARLWIDGKQGGNPDELLGRLLQLVPDGGTNLEAALDLAYETARKHFVPGGNNRVVLLTDGAANLGAVDPEALKQTVESFRKQGVALDCFGIGWEGYNDTLLESLSRNGDGRYGFVNDPKEADDDFAKQLAGALQVAASDVKVQVEFNPERVRSYRQIGYAKHQLKKEQFRDNTVDAAEIGAAESGNALYTIELKADGHGPIGVVRVRFKRPSSGQVEEREWPVPYSSDSVPLDQASSTIRLAATGAAFAEWLARSPYAGDVQPTRLLTYLSGIPELYPMDPRPKRLEWMIRQAGAIAGQ